MSDAPKREAWTIVAYASATYTCAVEAESIIEARQKVTAHIRKQLTQPGVSKINVQIRDMYTPYVKENR